MRGRDAWLLALGAALVLVTGVSGAIAALGDTLYPSASLAEGLRADLSAASHLIIRLRVMHPALAIGSGLAIIAIASHAPAPRGRILAACPGGDLRGAPAGRRDSATWYRSRRPGCRWSTCGADLLWIAYVLLGAQVLAARGQPSVASDWAHGREAARPSRVPAP